VVLDIGRSVLAILRVLRIASLTKFFCEFLQCLRFGLTLGVVLPQVRPQQIPQPIPAAIGNASEPVNPDPRMSSKVNLVLAFPCRRAEFPHRFSGRVTGGEQPVA
jgi:hypothetical protein